MTKDKLPYEVVLEHAQNSTTPPIRDEWNSDIKEAVRNPVRASAYSYDADVRYYYRDLKRKQRSYLLVIVKYLNKHGFIVTAYFTRQIKWKGK